MFLKYVLYACMYPQFSFGIEEWCLSGLYFSPDGQQKDIRVAKQLRGKQTLIHGL